MTVQQTTDQRPPAVAALPPRARPWLLIGSGLLVLLAVLAADGLIAERTMAEEGPPDLGFTGLARMGFIALGSVLVIVGITPPWGGGPQPSSRSDRVTRIAALGGPAIAVGSALLLVADPTLLNRLVVEDQVVEWTSAALCFVSAFLLLGAAGRYWRHRDFAPTERRTTTSILLVAGAAVAAVLGFEEVSWFQRVLDIESPDAFLNRNRQGEINFHNFATGATGNGYYLGGFLALVAVPFAAIGRRLPRPLLPFEPLIPPIPVLVAAAPAAAIVYEMWNISWIQATFWMGLTAALIAAVRDPENGSIAAVSAAAMMVTVVAYLWLGDTMVRSWDDTEVRELVIPFGLALYGYTLVRAAPGGSKQQAK